MDFGTLEDPLSCMILEAGMSKLDLHHPCWLPDDMSKGQDWVVGVVATAKYS